MVGTAILNFVRHSE